MQPGLLLQFSIGAFRVAAFLHFCIAALPHW
jgi:hypothetical protein